MEMKISVIIIAKNAENLIVKTLQSVTWVDEIVLIDTGSTDKTIDIAQKYKAKIFKTNKGGFPDWRNFGSKKANSEWILYVDSDEQVPELLKEEIIKTINTDTNYSAYAIPRLNNILGKNLKYGGWYPDYVLRLIKKDSLIRWEGNLHEQPIIKGDVGKLKNHFNHITHRSISEMLQKTIIWSDIEAKLMFQANHPKMNLVRFFTAVFREFWKRGVKKLGFLDGKIGFIEVVYQMFSVFISYAKLWELQEKERLKNESINL